MTNFGFTWIECIGLNDVKVQHTVKLHTNFYKDFDSFDFLFCLYTVQPNQKVWKVNVRKCYGFL